MAMHKILTPTKRIEFEKLVRRTKNIDEKDRLRAVLAYDLGHDVYDIAEILQISESTTYNYINDYLSKNKIAHNPRGGSDTKLSARQEIELIKHLYTVTYLTARAICTYVFTSYKVKYTIAGMTKWLERNDFVYKKPKSVPGKLNEEQQQLFIKNYEALKATISPNEIIMFMDAVHPEYQSQAVAGWMPKGEIKTLATTNTQFRLHLNGAIDLQNMDIFIREYDTINGASIISFFADLEQEYPDKTIHIICDNGRSNKNKELDDYLKNSRIKIQYLPPYSPNLNPIERLWKVMRENLTYNKVYSKFAEFTDAVGFFFNHKVQEITNELRSRINDNFEIIRHNPVQLSS
jgi:transposase